ncbi:MSMEG_0570 family nitrogen starvation response protein [Nocardioides sp. TRM66260-LWL]|uniref:MSMEG_0570 family nitrogen starvation response protein n=1 Tax=Nocardioides sp. TRM66260-LWL TaxID=2874478 RepID=UPI001CC808C0|nr:MSMEG_0570 family nitrogen starvation response protein [Nocardioides sp. TRM66260-LWL]MBZ5733667.1 MSMEG_0570 family nitrogen starvation response protein [Nocardioides sp. TRM66260-LWL]
MPEMTMTVRWPDGRVQDCYSPSLVLHDHLAAGARYEVAEFVERTATALGIASERVRARYGFACTSAAATLDAVRSVARRQPTGQVEVLRMWPPLPVEAARAAGRDGSAS